MELNNLIDFYSKKGISGSELEYLQIANKIVEWEKKSDTEKQNHRKSYVRMLEVHFKEEPDLSYFKQVILVTDLIISFLSSNSNSFNEYDNLTENDKYLSRIFNLLWCEKNFILYKESIRSINLHIPFDIFKPLVDKIEKTKISENNNLINLFSEYKKMINLQPNHTA
jgi:hypothetical protein